MTGLIDDLLDVSRVSRGLIELDDAALDIRHIATNAVEQATPLIEARRHRLALRLPPERVTVMGDEKRLVQVIANILNNAAKYTPEGGNIALAVDADEQEVVISVADDGIGMERELTERAFELFAQARRSSDRASGGLGLGLALVKSLVELHHGSVGCASAGIGKGSSFSVRLPRASEEESGGDGQQVHANLAATVNALRVMVVDDNVDAAAMLAMVLETLGYQVQVEHAPLRALERGRSEPPQVFLLDIGLPGIDGNELARRLRAQHETAGATLIAVTGYGQDSDRKVTLAAGFDHHLVKPVDLDVLASILAAIR